MKQELTLQGIYQPDDIAVVDGILLDKYWTAALDWNYGLY